MTEIAVKPLEWVSIGPGRWRAQGPVCSFDIWHQWASNGNFQVSAHIAPHTDNLIGDGFISLEKAKTAAQVDYKRRILSAITTPKPSL